MDLSTLKDAAPTIAGAITALASFVGVLRGPGRLRSKIKTDTEIATAMPAGNARDKMLEFLDDQVSQLIEDETEHTRDWPMLVFSVFAAIVLAAATLWLLQEPNWWRIGLAVVAAVLWMIFLYGIFETGQRVKRDEKGNRVPRS